MLRISVYMPRIGLEIPPTADSIMIETPLSARSVEEDALYEFYCNIADRAAGRTITVIITRERHLYGEERLQLALRALLRASVYGRFSLLFRGILTDEDINGAMRCLHRAFCELESEGREFNGYIPRGWVIDTPLLLCSPIHISGADTVCLDVERLSRLLTAMSDPCNTRELAAPLSKALTNALSCYPTLQKSVILSGFGANGALFDGLWDTKVSEYFFIGNENFSTGMDQIAELIKKRQKNTNFF